MASETSTVFVAVRIRPFAATEDPLGCTLFVPDDTTVTVVDIPSLTASSSSADNNNNNNSNNNNNTNSSAAARSMSMVSLGVPGGSSSSNAAGGFGSEAGGGGPARHSYTFDKIFWSVQPNLLPIPMTELMSVASGTATTTATGGGGGKGDGSGAATGGSGGGKGAFALSRSASVASHGLTSVSGESAFSQPHTAATAASPSAAGSAAQARRRSSVAAGSSLSGGTNSNTGVGGATSAEVQRRVVAAAALSHHLPCACRQPAYDDQGSMYEFLGPLLYRSVMNGFNACLFAYGQTGSGKSYSMMGPADRLGSVKLAGAAAAELGMMPRLCQDLFRLMKEERERNEDVTFSVEVSFFEIYCEHVRDLLSSGSAAAATTTANSASNSHHHHHNAAGGGGGLRVRQHPVTGAYVDGLQRHKVSDAAGVVRCMVQGLRERATAETQMNAHSSRSHAIMQLQIVKVTVSSGGDDADGTGVVTRTRSCKVNLVDLAGSERVSQSGVSGQAFEEAKNINQSLSTLGRVIQQLSEKQAGKRVIPAYRESVLTWLLADSLGGNSKTVMLATISPSAYCYQQTLNTLRFAGVAKKVVNVATVNEDRHYQQIVADLRQQLVRLTLQLESGKAAEALHEELRRLRAEKDALAAENDGLRVQMETAGDFALLADQGAGADGKEGGAAATIAALKQRLQEAEEANKRLHAEKLALQQRLLSTASQLREELAERRAEVIRLHETVGKKEAEVSEWAARYRSAKAEAKSAATVTATSAKASPAAAAVANAPPAPAAVTAAPRGSVSKIQAVPEATTAGLAPASSSSSSPAAAAAATSSGEAESQLRRQADHYAAEAAALKQRLHKASQEVAAAQRAARDAADQLAALQPEAAEYRRRYEETAALNERLQTRVNNTTQLLERTQQELQAYTAQYVDEAERARAAQTARDATVAAQLEQLRQDYLSEKQTNVQLLMRVSQADMERSQLKKDLAARQADVVELEQLMLEETETSERYYMRMRYHRAIGDMQSQFISKLAFAASHGEARRRASGTPSAATPTAGDTASINSPGLFSGRSTPAAGLGLGFSGSLGGASPTSARALWAADPLSQSVTPRQLQAQQMELAFAQLEYECLCEERQGRAQIQEGYLSGLLRLWAQHGRLQQAQHARAREGLQDAQEKVTLLEEELQFHREKLQTAESDLTQELGRQAEAQERLRQADAERARLARQLQASHEELAEAAAANDALVAKVAQVQSSNEELMRRCEEAERVVAEAMEAYYEGLGGGNGSGRGSSGYGSPLSPTDAAASASGGDNDGSSGSTSGGGGNGGNSSSSAMAHRAMQAMMSERRAVQGQCDALREELASLNQLLARANEDRVAQKEDHDAETAALQEQIRQLKSERLQLLRERGPGGAGGSLAASAAAEYATRLQQQQDMVASLRKALEDESATADACREAARRAAAAQSAAEEELLALRETCGELRQRNARAEGRHAEVQRSLDQLREEYALLERQLVEMRKREPELYLTLEKGANEDSAAWIEKARRERANLHRQKMEARRMNSELLEHVRRRNHHLRDVQRQMSELGDLSLSTTLTNLDMRSLNQSLALPPASSADAGSPTNLDTFRSMQSYTSRDAPPALLQQQQHQQEQEQEQEQQELDMNIADDVVAGSQELTSPSAAAAAAAAAAALAGGDGASLPSTINSEFMTPQNDVDNDVRE